MNRSTTITAAVLAVTVASGLGAASAFASETPSPGATSSSSASAAPSSEASSSAVASSAAPSSPARLSEDAKQDLIFSREEERMARDLYQLLADKYDGARPFSNIARSESRHFENVGALLSRYGIEDPSAGTSAGTYANDKLQNLYDEWKAKGETSLEEAYQVGIALEKRDIEDLKKMARSSVPTDVSGTYQRLLRASEQHLAAYTAAAEGKTLGNRDGQGMRQGRGPGGAGNQGNGQGRGPGWNGQGRGPGWNGQGQNNGPGRGQGWRAQQNQDDSSATPNPGGGYGRTGVRPTDCPLS